ncbi:MAG: metallopeptidase family protein [Actinomycetia bacterium]|nr:metallopeptidase family protein [Actinomycetes bacterium]
MVRRHRHGRSLRVTGGVSPRSGVGLGRLAPVVDAAAIRLARLTGAGHSESAIPAFDITVAPLPPGDQIDQSEPSDVTGGALLAGHQTTSEGAIVITLFARPLLLWADGTGVSLTSLVRQAMAEQLATAVGLDAQDLDPEAN